MAPPRWLGHPPPAGPAPHTTCDQTTAQGVTIWAPSGPSVRDGHQGEASDQSLRPHVLLARSFPTSKVLLDSKCCEYPNCSCSWCCLAHMRPCWRAAPLARAACQTALTRWWWSPSRSAPGLARQVRRWGGLRSEGGRRPGGGIAPLADLHMCPATAPPTVGNAPLQVAGSQWISWTQQWGSA